MQCGNCVCIFSEGPQNEGCGCHFSPFGCCPDAMTLAQGANFTGCHCTTFPHGCCEDGDSVAQGPNLEGCFCNSEHGCCPDGVTPRVANEECGCESTKFGCCLDGVSIAEGPLFQGCNNKPEPQCHLPPETGPCRNYTAMWFYDTKYGGCSRFWYGGCDPGLNHFEDELECNAHCVDPPGPQVCFLQKNVGSCQGRYNEWYFDIGQKTCSPFVYSGCLGNGNRFLTQNECQDMCTIDQEDTALCLKPKMEGGCDGDFDRWYFDADLGRCIQCNYLLFKYC